MSSVAPSNDEVKSTSPHKPVTLIKAGGGWRSVDVVQLWACRELLYHLIWRDVKVRYKQTVLGASWAILQPLMTMLVFTIFFGRLARMSDLVDIPYPVFVFTGLLAWTLFASIVSHATGSLVNSAHIVSKVYFPRLLIPLSTAGAALVDFLLSLLVFACLMACYGVLPSLNLLLLPLFVAGIVMAALGVGTLAGALVVTYRDLGIVISFVTQLWMFVSPVAYPLDAVPVGWQLVYAINPMAGMISGFRSCLLGEAFHWDCIGVSFLAAAMILIAGVFYFRRVENHFADMI